MEVMRSSQGIILGLRETTVTYHMVIKLFFFKYLFIDFFHCPESFCVWTFSSCGKQASLCGDFFCYGAGALDSQAQQLWPTDLVAPGHVESSQIRDQTCVPCIGWRILTCFATRDIHMVVNLDHMVTGYLLGFSTGKMLVFLFHTRSVRNSH